MQSKNIPSIDEIKEKKVNMILFCGALEHSKNPILAIKGFGKFLGSGSQSDWRMCIIGKGSLIQECKKLSQQINNRFGYEAIEFVDHSELYKKLMQARIFLSLQDHDNYPSQSLMEAMLFCCLIIATNVGDTSVLVSIKNGNILLNSSDTNSLANGLMRLSCFQEISENNRNMILENHNIKEFASYFMKMQRQLR